jgi:AAA family ATP:ADP antiporter
VTATPSPRSLPRSLPRILLAAAMLAALFASYGILKPLRDSVGQAFGRDLLPRIWLGTAIVTVLGSAALAAAVSRWPRRRLATVAFAAFGAITLASYFGHDAYGGTPGQFADASAWRSPRFWIDAAFYWWVSAYLPLALALFWGLMADVHGEAASRRSFGPIAFGGTFGQLAGARLAGVEGVSSLQLLGIASALLAVTAVLCAAIARSAKRDAEAPRDHAVGGNWLDGFKACVRSPYLGAILGYVALQTFAAAALTLEVTDQVNAHFGADKVARRTFNADINFWAQAATLGVQLLLVGPVLSRLGAGGALAAQPLAYAAGFAALAWLPAEQLLMTVAACEVFAKGATNYGLAKPARDALFTVCTPQDKYKAKSAIDAAAFRVFDYVFGETTNLWRGGLGSLVGSGVLAVAIVTVPVALGWAVVAIVLGRMHRARASK